MDIYESLNQMLVYIENHLDENIDYNVLAKFLGVNIYTMQRLFSLLCNISLAEYIRKRRLSNAGYDLAMNKVRIIDVAMKYQYDNATSFSRAFTKFHGIKPSIVKKNPKQLKNFPKIYFHQTVAEKSDIEYKIIYKEAFTIYGKGMATNNANINKDAPKFFSKIKNQYVSQYGFPDYGMVSYEDRVNSDKYEYWVLWKEKIDGFEAIHFPKTKWLSFTIFSQEAKDIQKNSDIFYEEFLPSCQFNLKDIPELEYYHDGITEFLIAIE